MLIASNTGSLIKGFLPAPNAPVISHLQFADDTHFFCDANENEVVSSLKVNFHKSGLLGVMVEEPLLSRLSYVLRCRVGKFPASYLGLPLCTTYSPKSM